MKKQRRLRCFIILFWLGIHIMGFSQQTLNYTHKNKEFDRALDLFQKQKYAAAQKHFDHIISGYPPEYRLLKADASYYAALCALELFQDDAEYRIARFIDEYPESPNVNKAYFQMGKYQYQRKRNNKAVFWFEKVEKSGLTENEKAEYYFKLGYSYYMEDDKEKAKPAFFEILTKNTPYAAPASYYYSHIAYTEGNYETALKGFEALQNDETFAVVVPYYMIQIYFLQEKYDKVIETAPLLVEGASAAREAEINRLVGASYIKKKNYKEAIPYLEKFIENAGKINREDYYELAYAYYQLSDYEKAARYFERVSNEQDELSQNTFYHLADCYLEMNDKNRAKMAFANAAKLDADPVVREDAMFNYAKITYELSYSPFNEAIRAFDDYIEAYPESNRNDEAYNFLVMAYLSTKNYRAALSSLEKINDPGPGIREAYQKVAFYRALELFNNLDYQGAISYFDLSLKYPDYNRSLKAKAFYWKGEAYYRLKDYDNAVKSYDRFLVTPGAFTLEEYNDAHYALGYAYFNKQQYAQANSWFRKFVNLKNNKKRLLADAYNRIGDGFFILTEYWTAISYYEKAIELNSPDADYAVFQKGFSLGLLDRQERKIEVLDKIITSYPESKYFDDALFEQGISYVKLNQDDKAIAKYNRIIAGYPSSSYVNKARVQLGLIYYNRNQYDKALDNYKKVVLDAPGSVEADNALVGTKNIYVEQNDVEGYFTFARQVGKGKDIRESERDSLLYISGENLYMQGNCEKAVQSLSSYIQTFPSGSFLVNAHFYKAECQRKSNQVEKALLSYDYVINRSKNAFTEQALLSASEIQMASGRYEEAVKYYEKLHAVAEFPANVLTAQLGLVEGYFRLKDYEHTVSSAREVLKISKLPDEKERETRYRLAKSLFEMNRKEEALNEYRKLASEVKSKQGAEAKYRVANILFEQGKLDEAEKEIFDFIDKNTPHAFWMAQGFILLGDIYAKKNDFFQAKYTLQSVIEGYENTHDGIIQLAKDRLQAIEELEKMRDNKGGEDEMELRFNKDTK